MEYWVVFKFFLICNECLQVYAFFFLPFKYFLRIDPQESEKLHKRSLSGLDYGLQIKRPGRMKVMYGGKMERDNCAASPINVSTWRAWEE